MAGSRASCNTTKPQSRKVLQYSLLFLGVMVLIMTSIEPIGQLTHLVFHDRNTTESIIPILLSQSHISVFHDRKPPFWLTNSTVVRIHVPPLRKVFGWPFLQPQSKVVSLSTDANYSYFQIINPKRFYNLCDILEIKIFAKNKRNVMKSHGGDYFFVRIHSPDLQASANPDGGIIDHQNGSYTARFKLRWTGHVRITVTLMHSSEAVSVLRRMRDYLPARQAFDGIFRRGNNAKRVPCHVTPLMFVKSWENTSTEVEFCNFTDPVTRSPWYCTKPKYFPCSSYSHHAGSERGNEVLLRLVSISDRSLIAQPMALNSSGRSLIKVGNLTSHLASSSCLSKPLSQCNMGKIRNAESEAGLPGYYYNNTWTSLKCRTTEYRDNISRCLRNKTMYFLGDSTIRQWFIFIIEQFEQHKLQSVIKDDMGFRMGKDSWKSQEYNLSMHYHHHGFPNRISLVPTTDVHYVANMIDSLSSHGTNTVYFISTGAHFTITNLDFYRNRLRGIKDAIYRLHEHSPDTPIIIKSANTREPTSTDRSNWYHEELNTVLYEEMSGIPNVVLVDVWNMTTGHSSGWNIHPTNSVIENEISLALSFICPKGHKKEKSKKNAKNRHLKNNS
ncbi:NXPE family member 3-like [Amphiura filiformis]|uniref:NXPE family member 3-like n=1 Tax=Amphiura filiformis TaxID=82378 RepID=UPI003B20F270